MFQFSFFFFCLASLVYGDNKTSNERAKNELRKKNVTKGKTKKNCVKRDFCLNLDQHNLFHNDYSVVY